jgi:hypothetical protein
VAAPKLSAGTIRPDAPKRRYSIVDILFIETPEELKKAAAVSGEERRPEGGSVDRGGDEPVRLAGQVYSAGAA